MRNLRHRIAVVVSVLLLMVLSLLWIYSHFREGVFKLRPTNSLLTVHLILSRGSISCVITKDIDYQVGPHRCSLTIYPNPPDSYLRWRSDGNLIYFGGFVLERPEWVPNRLVGVLLPIWFPLVLSLILPAAAIERRIVAAHRRRRNRCMQCGYDLRATVDRCPECGRPIEKLS